MQKYIEFVTGIKNFTADLNSIATEVAEDKTKLLYAGEDTNLYPVRAGEYLDFGDDRKVYQVEKVRHTHFDSIIVLVSLVADNSTLHLT